jgi:hypothetical protein
MYFNTVRLAKTQTTGSSGGPICDKDGTVFAMHRGGAASGKANCGVAIDRHSIEQACAYLGRLADRKEMTLEDRARCAIYDKEMEEEKWKSSNDPGKPF